MKSSVRKAQKAIKRAFKLRSCYSDTGELFIELGDVLMRITNKEFDLAMSSLSETARTAVFEVVAGLDHCDPTY